LPGRRWCFLSQQADDAAALGHALADKYRHIIQLRRESLRITGDQVPCCLNLIAKPTTAR
jgi:hypothetical protein